MKIIKMKVKYAGAEMAVNIFPEQSCNGIIYPVEVDGKYVFSFLEDEDEDWSVMKEADATTPLIQQDLFDAILKKLHYELLYVA